MYAAQEIPQIDAEIAQKGHFRVETKYYFNVYCKSNTKLSSVFDTI